MSFINALPPELILSIAVQPIAFIIIWRMWRKHKEDKKSQDRVCAYLTALGKYMRNEW